MRIKTVAILLFFLLTAPHQALSAGGGGGGVADDKKGTADNKKGDLLYTIPVSIGDTKEKVRKIYSAYVKETESDNTGDFFHIEELGI